jgi:hypothetical protein
MGEVNMGPGYDSVGYRKGPPGYNEAAPKSPGKDSQGTMSSVSGEYPLDHGTQQYDAYGRPIVETQNVHLYVSRRGQPGENGQYGDQFDSLRTAGGVPVDLEDGSWEWDDENQAWKRSWMQDGEEYVEYVTKRVEGDKETLERWVQKKVYIHGDVDHDAALAAAIGAVIDVNPDLAVEKIEIETTKDVQM